MLGRLPLVRSARAGCFLFGLNIAGGCGQLLKAVLGAHDDSAPAPAMPATAEMNFLRSGR